MRDDFAADLLSAYLDHWSARNGQPITPTLLQADLAELGGLLLLAHRLKRLLRPVEPAPAFVATLKESLLAAAAARTGRRPALWRRPPFVIGATLGSLVSVAAVLMVVTRVRTACRSAA